MKEETLFDASKVVTEYLYHVAFIRRNGTQQELYRCSLWSTIPTPELLTEKCISIWETKLADSFGEQYTYSIIDYKRLYDQRTYEVEDE